MYRTAKLVTGIITLTLVAGCGGGDGGGSAPGPVATAAPTPTPTPTPTLPPRIQAESGNQQSVNRGNLLTRPLQVRLATADGAAASNVSVVFTGFRNAGLNIPDTAQTDASGIATWLPGYFHIPGIYAITASAAGYSTVKFTVNVAATPYQFDGFYHCRTSSTVLNLSLKVTIRNNQVTAVSAGSTFGGGLNGPGGTASITPGTDILLISLEDQNNRLDGSAHITFDAEGTARPSGGFLVRRKSNGALSDFGNFSCLRD